MDNLKILRDYLSSNWNLDDSGGTISYERVKDLGNWVEIHWDTLSTVYIYIHVRHNGKDITKKVTKNTVQSNTDLFISYIKMIERKIWIEDYRDEVLKDLLDE